MAFLYQLSMVVGMVSMDMIRRMGNSSGVISDENIFVVDSRHSYVVLEEGGVFGERWGVFVSSSILPWFLYHSLGGKAGDGVGFYVMVFEHSLKFAMKVVKVPMAMVDPTKALCWNVVAQVRAGPSVI